jgi:hypothetical protein
MAVAEGEFKYSTTHVEAFPDMSRDAGSIPAASTKTPFARNRKRRFFMDLRRSPFRRLDPDLAHIAKVCAQIQTLPSRYGRYNTTSHVRDRQTACVGSMTEG